MAIQLYKCINDEKKLKAISSETRLKILKLLAKKPMTLTELSETLELKKTTVLEHLQILMNSNLIVRENTDRKWKYYELSLDGKRILRELMPSDVLVSIFSLLVLFVLKTIIYFKEKTPQVKAVALRAISYETQSTGLSFSFLLTTLIILFAILTIFFVYFRLKLYFKIKKLKQIEKGETNEN
ncbi:MAG: winged helix-turn-helix domain-containing protein [Candidatus Woesearchaeota archaeon]